MLTEIKTVGQGVTGQAWIEALLRVAAHYRLPVSPQSLAQDSAWAAQRPDLPHKLARGAGLALEAVPARVQDLSSLRLPVLAEMADGRLAVIESETREGFALAFTDDKGLITPLSREDLGGALRALYLVRPIKARADLRVDSYLALWRPDWLRGLVLPSFKPYRPVMVASLVSNVLALAGTIFSMQVYDRVVPSQSLQTLDVLFIGVGLATLFAWAMKIARSRITDAVGKAADLRVSDRVFGHALRVKSMARPKATGTFISQVRELEHVREMLTSSTVTALADLPFFVLFCALFAYICGPLVWIPAVAAVAMVVPGVLLQKRLRRLAEEGARESTLRSAMLVETVQGLDDIKILQAESRFQNLWNHYNESSAQSAMELRDLIGRLTAWSQTVQGAVFALVLYFGAPQVMAGEMSTGVLVAGSMLSSRMLSPLGGVTQLINRWQQAKVAREGLDRLMQLPLDSPEDSLRIHRPLLRGQMEMREAVFGHDAQTPAIQITKLSIAPGEQIAILGRNGAGKSTLLAALAGLLEPLSGEYRVDDLVAGLIDPADLRRDIVLLSQNARLFHGTLRENLTLGAPMAGDEVIMAALTKLRLADFVQRLPDGLDHMIQEGGLGLSGGQRQALLVARLLLRAPRVLLLDEPTAALDEMAEAALIDLLLSLDPDLTLVVATHRPAVLRAVNRLVVMGGGKIVLDGPKDQVMAKLQGGKAA